MNEVSRRDFLKLAGIAGIVFPSVLSGCSKEQTSSTTSSLAPTTTLEKPTTTITTQKETTTTEALTTTTTESKVGINLEFISTERTIDDVTGKIERGIYVSDPIGKIPKDLQSLLQSENPEKRILWVGPSNRGSEMNAVLTDKGLAYKDISFVNDTYFFGGDPQSKLTGGNITFIGEFKDILPITNSNDFYVRAQNPLNEQDIYGRMVLDRVVIKYEIKSVMNVFRLDQKYQSHPSDSKGNLNTDHYVFAADFLAENKLGKFIQPGDKVFINFVAFDGKAIKDEKGVQMVAFLTVERFNGADKIESLYK